MSSGAGQSDHLVILEANARLLLRRLSARYGRRLTLGTVPVEYWQGLSHRYQYLWLMGVWERSDASRELALASAPFKAACSTALPDWDPRDIDGSPYAVKRYELDPALGRHDELNALRQNLASVGMRLILDFVPNHVARDHAWVREWPELFIRPSTEELAQHPEHYSMSSNVAMAHGRDPYHAPWTDTAQLNLSSPETRRALVSQLLAIAPLCDGVRCDMAMLALNEVHARTWQTPTPATEFWALAIDRVRRDFPSFVFIAEAYWELEPRLIELGFDYAYDKGLYDALRVGAGDVDREIASDPLGTHALRFIENHDEERASTVFGSDRSFAAAALAATLPGAFLVHDGQLEGRRRRLPVQLTREPDETADSYLKERYDALLAILNEAPVVGRSWTRLARESVARGVFVWVWRDAGCTRLVAVNYSEVLVHEHISLDELHMPGRSFVTRLATEGTAVSALADEQLQLELGAWAVYIADVGTD